MQRENKLTEQNCPYCNHKLPINDESHEVFKWHLNNHNENKSGENKWQERFETRIGKSLLLLISMQDEVGGKITYDILTKFIQSEISRAVAEERRKIVEMINTTEPSPNLNVYLDKVKNGNKDDMYDYGVKITREMCINLINK